MIEVFNGIYSFHWNDFESIQRKKIWWKSGNKKEMHSSKQLELDYRSGNVIELLLCKITMIETPFFHICVSLQIALNQRPRSFFFRFFLFLSVGWLLNEATIACCDLFSAILTTFASNIMENLWMLPYVGYKS